MEARTLFEKVWDNHVVYSEPGKPVILYIDLHLVHEVTSPQAFEGLRLSGRKVRVPERTFATMDHNVPTDLAVGQTRMSLVEDAVARAQMMVLDENCKSFGIKLYDIEHPEQGIVHVIGPELGLTQPGMTIVCGDSHTSTHGAFGAFAFGIGTSEVEHVLATQTIRQNLPKTMEIRIDGALPFGVTAKDLILGIIGEIGCSWPLDKNEHKVLKASAKAQRLTGAPILIHPGRDETSPLEILEVLRESGAHIDRTIIGHLDRTVFKRTTLEEIARSGCYMEWDLFGREESFYPLNPNIDMPNDAKKMDDIAWISELGYEDKVVVAHDICSKHRLETYGGHGYYYILDHIVPRMRKRGYSEDAVHKIIVQNPQAILTFTDPSD